jgi:DNA-binding NarL/FixJ family response regulator
LDNRPLNRTTAAVSVYVLEQNPLAAEYLRRILSKDSQLLMKTVTSMRPEIEMKEDGYVLVVNQAGIADRVPEFVGEVEHCFQSAGLVFVGELTFWRELQKLRCHQHVGFVTYSDVPKKLIATIKRIANRLPTARAVTGSTDLSPSRREQLRVWSAMTRRESEILELIRHRLSNKEIANILNVAEVTVKFHVSNILSKASVDRRRNLLALMDDAGDEAAAVENMKDASSPLVNAVARPISLKRPPQCCSDVVIHRDLRQKPGRDICAGRVTREPEMLTADRSRAGDTWERD